VATGAAPYKVVRGGPRPRGCAARFTTAPPPRTTPGSGGEKNPAEYISEKPGKLAEESRKHPHKKREKTRGEGPEGIRFTGSPTRLHPPPPP